MIIKNGQTERIIVNEGDNPHKLAIDFGKLHSTNLFIIHIFFFF